MHSPGDVVLFWSDEADKEKYHLCISLNGKYLFVNSPKKRLYPGDLILPCSDFPFLDPTVDGNSIISCTLIVGQPPKNKRAVVKGKVSSDVLLKIIAFVEDCAVIGAEDRDAILNGLGDWV
jgi:hypothetical protein